MRRPRGWQRGQALVEFTLAVPVMLLLLVSLLEFGLAFNHRLTLAYATREGARTASALANGGGTLGCGAGGSPNAASVDPAVIAAVQRILESPGSPIVLASISDLRIYRAQANNTGNQNGGQANVWAYAPGAGPLVDGRRLDFTQRSVGWQTCARTYRDPADSVGVQLTYRYDLATPIGALLRLIGGQFAASFTITDETVMQVNPVN